MTEITTEMQAQLYSSATEYLARLNGVISAEEHETRQRIERMAGLDGDASAVSRREWSAFYQRTSLLRAEVEAITMHLARQKASEPVALVMKTWGLLRS